MYLSKSCKYILKYTREHDPGRDLLYNGYDIVKDSHFTVAEIGKALVYLHREDLIEMAYPGATHLFRPTLLGDHYASFSRYSGWIFIRNSIIVPIVVSILTNGIIYALKLLL